jgi:hypothetical protein
VFLLKLESEEHLKIVGKYAAFVGNWNPGATAQFRATGNH